jgi:DNA-binding GntR family transcriptional regulator
VSIAGQPAALKWDHGLRRQNLVESLLADVFQGRLRAGEHLVTRELAERFGVSHTPIREALIALAGIGIVDLLPNRGAVVRRVTAGEVREVCQVRQVLECTATRLACGRIELVRLHDLARDLRHLMVSSRKDEGGRMKDESEKNAPDSSFILHPSSFIERARVVDSRLHDQIADACGNAFLAKELGRLKILFRAFRDVAWAHDEARNDYHRLTEEAHEHLAIVEALLAGKPREAARAMAHHIRSGARYWTRAVPTPTGPETQEATSRKRKGKCP